MLLMREELGSPPIEVPRPADVEAGEVLARHVLETATEHRAGRLAERRGA